MENIKITKTSTCVILSALLAAVMLVCPFFEGNPITELMEEMEFPGLLLWVYYVTFAITVIFSVFQKDDFAKLFAMINLAVLALNIIVVLIDYGDGNFMERIGVGMYGCLIASAVSTVSITKHMKEK